MEQVIIIGGGPAGLAASLYLARAGLKPLVFAGSPPGGQLILTSEVENYPGFESILGPELIAKFRSHAQKFGVRIVDKNVSKIEINTSPFVIYTAGTGPAVSATRATQFTSRSIIIATGAKALWLGLESEQRLRGKGVSACATCDGFFFKNKVVAVAGGGDTAFEEALTLTQFASKVYLIHRRDSFRASKIMQERVFKNPKIEVMKNTAIEEVVGEQKVEGIRLKSVVGKNPPPTSSSLLKIDGLFVAIGHRPDTDLFKDSVELDERGYVVTSARKAIETMKSLVGSQSEPITGFNFNYQTMTSVNGVFAAGDCADHKYRQAATATGLGVAAALEVEKWLVLNQNPKS